MASSDQIVGYTIDVRPEKKRTQNVNDHSGRRKYA